MTNFMWEEDHNESFIQGRWDRAGGNLQSMTFMIAAMQELLASPVREILNPLLQSRLLDTPVKATTIRDYGCAMGDGTAVIASFFPMCKVQGHDISPAAIALAARRWPTIPFAVGNILEPEAAGIIFTSHTVEHLQDPAAAITKLRQQCALLIVIVPPLTKEAGGGHIGATVFDDWYSSIEKPILRLMYNTGRYNTETGEIMKEGNALLVYNGFLNTDTIA